MEYQKRYSPLRKNDKKRAYEFKILSITCDNASVNDVMIEELPKLVPNYVGKESHVRCFLHILNLVVKTVIKLFDSPGRTNKDQRNLSNDEILLARLAEGIELEEVETQGTDGGEADDDTKGYDPDVELLSDEEKATFEEGILPVRLAIVKVGAAIKRREHSLT